jgi:hypothetical protein
MHPEKPTASQQTTDGLREGLGPSRVKRVLDIVLSLLGLVVLSPLLALLVALVKLTSPGPALLRQERCGPNGRRFSMLKLRTLRADAERQSGPRWSVRGDPRVTRLGRFLRASHLDKLPRLWNVLCGDMSLFGHRPERPDEWHLKHAKAEAPDAARARIVEDIPADVMAAGKDAVTCAVFAPPSAAAGDSLLVQVFAHMLEQAVEAAALARAFDPQAERRGFKTLALPVRRGTALTCHLVMPGLGVDPALQDLPWAGRPEAVQFAVTVPADRRPGTVIGTVTVSQDGAPLGHIKFKLAIVAAPGQPVRVRNEPCGDAACRYRKAFVSYASADREEVLKRVQVLQRVGIDCFQDVLALEPGSRWEQQLYRHIDDSDLFLLFWSSAARQSQWVREELRYALRRQGADGMAPPEIKPVVIEGPPPPPPPEELAHLHFNDYFLYLLAGQRQARKGPGK